MHQQGTGRNLRANRNIHYFDVVMISNVRTNQTGNIFRVCFTSVNYILKKLSNNKNQITHPSNSHFLCSFHFRGEETENKGQYIL